MLVTVVLIAACRGEQRATRKDGGLRGSAAAGSAQASLVPKLPLSEDGATELRALDKRIHIHLANPPELIPLLLDRAAIRGQLEDYELALAASEAYVKAMPKEPAAWTLRVQVLARVHRFADARAALAELAKIAHASDVREPALMLDEATGADTLAARAELAAAAPTPKNVTLWAAALAAAGRFDDAIALIPKAAALVRHNPPQLLAWLLFQWGRLYEQKGELAAARDFYRAAFARMPGSVETVEHLATVLAATGDKAAAKLLVETTRRERAHPSLGALALELGVDGVTREAVAAEWERYVKALPEAFADHAARFYLGPGANPPRALALAKLNFANRPTRQARALVIDAAIAARDGTAACAVVEPFVAAGSRAEQFAAWKALELCGRADDANRLARALGIAPQ